MASDLSCVTLLPRPDRTGKLIAKVKRNKGATPSESLDRDSAPRRKREREREADRRACRDREKGRKRRRGGRGRERARARSRERERCKILSIGTSRPGNRFPRSIRDRRLGSQQGRHARFGFSLETRASGVSAKLNDGGCFGRESVFPYLI